MEHRTVNLLCERYAISYLELQELFNSRLKEYGLEVILKNFGGWAVDNMWSVDNNEKLYTFTDEQGLDSQHSKSTSLKILYSREPFFSL